MVARRPLVLDLFGRGFTLLRFGANEVDGSRLAAASGVPMTIETIAEHEARDLYKCKLALVRPDGHVAWRGDGLSGDAGEIIDRVRGA